MESLGVAGAMAGFGVLVQGWRAQENLPNWAVYPILLVCACLAQLLWGDAIDPRLFARGVAEAWLIALGVNRATSDAAKGTIFETRRGK